MKQHVFLFCTIFLIIALIPLFQARAQTTYSVPITLSLSNEGLNRTIAIQWSNPGFTKAWTGNIEELYYELHLDQPPIITLSTNLIKLSLNFWIRVYDTSNDMDIFTHKDYSVKTTMSISPINSNTGIIYAQYVDLHTDITNVLSDVDDRIRTTVEQKLSQINWVIYPGKILSISSTPLYVGSKTLSWSATPTFSASVKPEGILEIMVTTNIVVDP